MTSSNHSSVIFKVKVLPNATKFEVLGFDTWRKAIRVKVKSPALEGQANKELLQELSKFFDTQIEIVRGKKSSEKVMLAKKTSTKLSTFLKPNSMSDF